MDSRNCQTATASPAEPGELPFWLGRTCDMAESPRMARSADPNVFPTYRSLRPTKTNSPGAKWDEQRSPEGQHPRKGVVTGQPKLARRTTPGDGVYKSHAP